MAEKNLTPVTIENAEIAFRNFSGKEGTFNREGDRNFAVFLPEDVAEAMLNDGWNVKRLKPRPDADPDTLPQAFITVKVNFGGRIPPRINLITVDENDVKKRRQELDESNVNILDWVDPIQVDLILNPREYDVNGKQGVSCYLRALYLCIREDRLESKYEDVPDSAQNCVGDECELPPFRG